MKDKQEFSDTPNGDAAEEFLKSKGSQEPKPSILQKEALRLYEQAESVRKILQEEVLQKNPAFQNRGLLYKRHGIDLALGEETALEDIAKGEIDLSYWIERAKEHEPDSTEPAIILEGQEIVGISLRNGHIGPEINDDVKFRKGHTYEINLQRHAPEDADGDYIMQDFYVSDKGDWMKQRDADFGPNDEKSLEMTSNDLETVGTALMILKTRLTKALASPSQDQ